MHNNYYLKNTFRTMLTFFAAAVLCAVLFALPSSAETYTWNYVVSDNPVLVTGDIITIDNSTTATDDDTPIAIPTGATVTVTGTVTGKPVEFVVYLYENSTLIWNASVESTTTDDAVLSILGNTSPGVGKSVQINKADFRVNNDSTILAIGSKVNLVTMTDCRIINSGNGNGIGIASTGSPALTMTGGSIDVGGDGIDSLSQGEIQLTNVTISSRGILNSGLDTCPISHDGDAELTNVTIINENGNGADFGDSNRMGTTVLISGGSITSTGIGINAKVAHDAPDIAIEDCTIESSGAEGISILRGSLSIEGGTITGTTGVYADRTTSVTITGDATIIGTDAAGFGINSDAIPLTITPITDKIITVKGKAGAIDSTATTLAATSNYLLSPNYDGTGYSVANQDLTAYAPNALDLYAQFSLGTLPYVPPADPGDNTGGDNTGGDDTGGDNTGGGDTGGGDTGGDNTGGNYIYTTTDSGNSNNGVNYYYNYGYPYGYRYGYPYGYCPMMFPYCRMPMYRYCNYVIYIVVGYDRYNESFYDIADDIYKEEFYDLADDIIE